MNKKWLLLIGYAAAAVLLIINKDSLIDWIKNSGADQLYLVFPAVTLLAVVPIIPFGIVAGIIGMKYGAVVGGILNVSSSTTTAVLFFLLVRVMFQEQTRKWLGKFKRIDHFTSVFEKNAFMAVLVARLIPIIPAQAVNGYAAVSNMKFSSYFISTLLGKIPAMFVFAWIGDQMFADLVTTIVVLGVYTVFVLIVYFVYRRFGPKFAYRSDEE